MTKLKTKLRPNATDPDSRIAAGIVGVEYGVKDCFKERSFALNHFIFLSVLLVEKSVIYPARWGLGISKKKKESLDRDSP
jgi:hypothetical protein